MKRILCIIVASFLLTIGRLFAQDVSEIETAFQKANLALISDQINSSVDLILPSDERTVSKDDCISLVNQFLRSVSPKEFTVLHQGSRGDNKFLVAALKTARGEFRVHLLFKKVNTQYLISQLRIEPSNE